mgnify:CR=1 FL=1
MLIENRGMMSRNWFLCQSDFGILRTQETTTTSDISILKIVVHLIILCACWIFLAAIIQTRDSELILDLSFHLFQTLHCLPLVYTLLLTVTSK